MESARGFHNHATLALMGYHTDFIGHISIHPPLNEAEYSYLTAFGESRRYRRRGDDPYVVPNHPLVDGIETRDVPIDDYNSSPDGQPGLWCPWLPSCDGECVAIPEHDGKHYAPGPWLQYLVDHFLKPNAKASRVSSSLFDGFTFDHQLDGLMAACRNDTGQLWLIRPNGDKIEEEILWWGDYSTYYG